MSVMSQVTEILDNAIDEVQAGHATTVQVPSVVTKFSPTAKHLHDINT